jgi:hypothetical protein
VIVEKNGGPKRGLVLRESSRALQGVFGGI